MTDRDGFSSEDLLRQAREAMSSQWDDDASEDAPTSDEVIEAAAYESPETEVTYESSSMDEAETAPFADEAADEALLPPTDPFADRPDLGATAPPTEAETPEWAKESPFGIERDEPAELDDDVVTRPSDMIDLPQKSPQKKGFGIGTLIRVAVIGFVGFTFLNGFLDSSVSVDELSAGTCFQDPAADVVFDIDPVDCAEPHDYEAIGTVEVPGSTYPGDDPVWETAVTRCISTHFTSYVGIDYADSVWWIDAFTPTAEGWDDGDRTANCVVFQPNAAQTDIAPQTGSARGSRK
jgi:hypothetical protein